MSILPWAVVGAWGVAAVCVAITMCDVIMIAAHLIIKVFAACARQSPYRVLLSQLSSLFGAAMSVVIIKHDILPFLRACAHSALCSAVFSVVVYKLLNFVKCFEKFYNVHFFCLCVFPKCTVSVPVFIR